MLNGRDGLKLMTEKSEKLVALIDLDGTLADFDAGLLEGLKSLLSPIEWANPQGVNFRDQAPWYKARKHLICRQPGFWLNLPRIETGFAITQLLEDLGYQLHVLTKGPSYAENAWTEKKAWTRQHLPQAKITITEEKGLVYGKILFDDWVPYINDWLAFRPRGTVLMLDQLWNQGFEHPQVIRIMKDQTDFSEVEARVKLC